MTDHATEGPAVDQTRARRPAARPGSHSRTTRARIPQPAPPRRRGGTGRGSHPMRTPALAHPQRRVRAMFLGVCVVLSLFAVQLLRLQAVDATAVARQATDTRTRIATLQALRGSILDSGGALLAGSVERYDVVVNQRDVRKWDRIVRDPANPKKRITVELGSADAAAELAPILGMDLAKLTAKLTGDSRYAVVARAVTPAVWRAVDEQHVGGISGDRTSRRVHPSGGLAVPITGWVTSTDNRALGGVELMLNSTLVGRDGSTEYERDPSGREIATGLISTRPAVPGRDVGLTISRDLQFKAEQALAAQVKATGALSGTVVVMRVADGAILALANAPTVDVAAPGSVLSANLRNRAVEDAYEPGSTSKVMTAAAALEEGVVTPLTPFTVTDTLRRAGKTFHDSHRHPPERLTFAGVLAQSSNVGTIMAGERVPAATMYGYLTKFGIGQPTGLKLPSQSRGVLAPVDQWSGSQRYTVLFGQGLSVNAVQAAGVYQTLANGGVRMPPRLIDSVQRADGTMAKGPVGTGVRVVSATTAKNVVAMLEGVVSKEGTAPEAKIAGYRVAGKTGTAQRFDSTCSCYRGYTGSFIGLAPADAPQLVVAVTLQRPVKGYFGGTVAAPVFRDIMTYALQELQIPPTGATSPLIKQTPDGG